MPVFEMPLEQMRTYQGTNPRPHDFDQYWDRAIEEMKSLDPQVELIPHRIATSFADCFDLYFTGVRGARVHAKFLRPRNTDAPGPAILQFHGYYGSSGDWTEKLGYVAQGYSVAALDVRGQGGLSEDTGGVPGATLHGHIIRGLSGKPEDLLYRQIFLDCAQLAGIVMGMPHVDESRVGAQGGSQGGALTIACAALEPRIARAAATYPFLSDYQRVWDMDLAVDAYEEVRRYFKWFDPRHERREEIFTKLGYIDVQNLAPRIQAEVLMITGLMDTICPPSTQFAAYNKITSKKDLLLYPDFGHDELPGAPDAIWEFMTGL